MDRNLGIQIVRGHYELLEAYISNKATINQLWRLMRVSMPYTTQTLENGLELPLNRDYKPLGMPPENFYDYERFSEMAIPANKLNREASYKQDDYIYLFDDSCPPWRSKQELLAYMKRLQEVFGL